jgi:hypothetical protein
MAPRRKTIGLQNIPTWECGLTKSIVSTTFHFPEIVHMCAQYYDPIQRLLEINAITLFSRFQKLLF